jgi:hypothetical protein
MEVGTCLALEEDGMRGRTFGWAVATALAPLAIACGDGITEPEGGQVIALATIGGQALPVTLEPAPGYARTWVADTIHLGANDLWSRRQILEVVNPGEALETMDWSSDGSVERFEGEIVLAFECNDTGSCIAPDRLIPEEGGYRIERSTEVGVQIFRYRVVDG